MAPEWMPSIKGIFRYLACKKKIGIQKKKSPFFLENIFCVENYHYFWH